MQIIKLPDNPFSPEALAIITRELARPGVVIVQYAHDDGCPAIASQRDADCRPPCRPDAYLVRPGESQEQRA